MTDQLPNELSVEPIRCIAFDAVGTLLSPQPKVADVYYAAALRHGSRLTRAEISASFSAAFRATEQNDLGGSGEDAAARLSTSEEREFARWREIVTRVIADVSDLEACFAELYEHFARPDSWRCFDDVGPALSNLRSRGYRLLIASNFDRRLEHVVRGHSELQVCETCVISATVGFRKPSPRFYQALVNAAGCRPEELLMVGDDFENDVLGARAAGLQALMLNRTGPQKPGEIGSLGDLSRMIPGTPEHGLPGRRVP